MIDQVFLAFMASLDPFRKIASNLVDDEMRDRWWGVVDVVGGIGPRVIDLMDPQTGVEKERERRRREYTKITWIIFAGNCIKIDPC